MYQPARTKLSNTILRPALSKSTVSLLPSTVATVPVAEFRMKHPRALREGRTRARTRDQFSLDLHRTAARPALFENSRDGPALARRRAAFARCQPGVA